MAQALRVSKEANHNDDAGWRSFPQFERMLGTEDGAATLLEQAEKTCRHLNDILHSGSPPDKVRAQLAMTAYGRSLDLLHLLAEIRDRSDQK
jgi:hypothetical protein